MKRITFMIAALLTAFLPVLLASSAAAASTSAVQQITVTARVLPMRHIIVNSKNEIMLITSNTSLPVAPQVFVGTDMPDHARPLTREIYQRYNKLVPKAAAKPGILYDNTSSATSISDILGLTISPLS